MNLGTSLAARLLDPKVVAALLQAGGASAGRVPLGATVPLMTPAPQRDPLKADALLLLHAAVLAPLLPGEPVVGRSAASVVKAAEAVLQCGLRGVVEAVLAGECRSEDQLLLLPLPLEASEVPDSVVSRAAL